MFLRSVLDGAVEGAVLLFTDTSDRLWPTVYTGTSVRWYISILLHRYTGTESVKPAAVRVGRLYPPQEIAIHLLKPFDQTSYHADNTRSVLCFVSSQNLAVASEAAKR